MSYHGDFAHGTYENSKSGPIISDHPTTQVFLLKKLEKFWKGPNLRNKKIPIQFCNVFFLIRYFCSLLSFFCSHRNLFQLFFFSTEGLAGKNLQNVPSESSRVTVYKGAALGDVARLEAFGAADFGVAQWEADEAVAKPRTLAMHRAEALSSQSTGWVWGSPMSFFFFGVGGGVDWG